MAKRGGEQVATGWLSVGAREDHARSLRALRQEGEDDKETMTKGVLGLGRRWAGMELGKAAGLGQKEEKLLGLETGIG
jgi:hypothetical protein